MATARPVHATFPGTNGRIAFNHGFGDAFTMNTDGSPTFDKDHLL